eukprot:COSAG02_NODE_5597_length_4199_cov_11.472778_4_plen_53_part_00
MLAQNLHQQPRKVSAQLRRLQAKQLESQCEQDEVRRREVLRSTTLLDRWAAG